MREGRAKAILLAAIGWVVIVVLLAAAYRFFVRPRSEEELAGKTGSQSRYRETLTVAADSFSGYALLRAESLAEELRGAGVRLVVKDDGADYVGRMKALRDGDVQLAVFTIDSFISAGEAIDAFPASIVLILDETKGADAIVAYESGIKQITDLNDPQARIVATPSSPSEFLARTVIAHFNLPRLSGGWLITANGAEDVYRRFCDADRGERRAYVLWEPYVSKALREPGAHVLLDSGKLQGYIVDVLVAERTFLRDHADQVGAFVEAYLRVAYHHGRDADAMTQLIIDDARKTGGEKLTRSQAEQLVAGIRWKNTLENYAHFGLVEKSTSGGLRLIEDMIRNIASVLTSTGAMKEDPTTGIAHTLFYDRVLRDLQAGNFHPAKAVNLLSDAGLGTDDLEGVRGEAALTPLSDAQWDRLIEVGEMRVAPISFARGTARINVQSRRELAALAERLAAWPQYYLVVVGHARAIGDPEANRKLAEDRAAAAAEVLREAGIPPQRMRTRAVPLVGRGGDAQSVSFVFGQLPY